LAEGPNRDPNVLREVNDRVHDYALERDEPGQVSRFVCECSRPDCHEWVSLTLAEYESLRVADQPVFAAGHS
jgi:hypothetical protein